MAAPFDALWAWQVRLAERRVVQEMDAHRLDDIGADRETLQKQVRWHP